MAITGQHLFVCAVQENNGTVASWLFKKLKIAEEDIRTLTDNALDRGAYREVHMLSGLMTKRAPVRRKIMDKKALDALLKT